MDNNLVANLSSKNLPSHKILGESDSPGQGRDTSTNNLSRKSVVWKTCSVTTDRRDLLRSVVTGKPLPPFKFAYGKLEPVGWIRAQLVIQQAISNQLLSDYVLQTIPTCKTTITERKFEWSLGKNHLNFAFEQESVIASVAFVLTTFLSSISPVEPRHQNCHITGIYCGSTPDSDTRRGIPVSSDIKSGTF
jgi:hypothetical protein